MIWSCVALLSSAACSESAATAPDATAVVLPAAVVASLASVDSVTGTFPVDVIPRFTDGEENGGWVRQRSKQASPALPAVFLDFPYPSVTGRSIKVDAGDNLQSALKRARRGDEVVLAAGATFTGNFTLPALGGTAADGWITIRGEASDRLPPLGTRVSPADGLLMPKVVTPNTEAALRLAPAASGWRMVGLEVTVLPAVTQQQYGLLWLGDGSRAQNTLASVPSDIVLDRMYIHGQPTTNMSRCVALNSARTQISDSYLAECHGRGFDSQAIWGGNGPGPYKIVNNMLMGAGENIMFGGADPSIPNLVPSDIEIRRNYFYTPMSWKGVWLKKNLFETKNAVRVLVEGNVFDGSWTDGQTGWGFVLKSANQSGTCNWCRSTDITIQRNLIRNVGAGLNIMGNDGGGGLDTMTRRVRVTENVVEINQPGDLRGFQLINSLRDISLTRNVLSGTFNTAMHIENGVVNCSFADNVWAHGLYGIFSSGVGSGTNALNAGCGSTWTWSGMTLVSGQQGGYPPTTWVSSEASAPSAAQIRGIVQQAINGVIIP